MKAKLIEASVTLQRVVKFKTFKLLLFTKVTAWFFFIFFFKHCVLFPFSNACYFYLQNVSRNGISGSIKSMMLRMYNFKTLRKIFNNICTLGKSIVIASRSMNIWDATPNSTHKFGVQEERKLNIGSQ